MLTKFALLIGILVSTHVASAAPSVVAWPVANAQPGTIIIKESQRKLYFILEGGKAIRYPVAVPRGGMSWSGRTWVTDKRLKPAWAAPDVVRRDNPDLPAVIPGGAPNNPMGAAAILLAEDEVAIHGTTQTARSSIGTSASYGCIRMYNEDVLDLYARVRRGTVVIMMR